MTTRLLPRISFLAWLIASVSGMAVLWDYETRPSKAAAPPATWPLGSSIPRPDRPTLLVWIHPKCPCSRASVAELERLLVHFPENVDCRAVLTSPPGSEPGFTETSLTRSIRTLPGVSVVIDHDQREATRFGVATSGQVLLYDQMGSLSFAGGITPGRGHQGDSVGASMLFNRLHGVGNGLKKPDDVETCCVYGCSLFTPLDEPRPSP